MKTVKFVKLNMQKQPALSDNQFQKEKTLYVKEDLIKINGTLKKPIQKQKYDQSTLLGRPLSFRECNNKDTYILDKNAVVSKKCLDINLFFVKEQSGNITDKIIRHIALRNKISCSSCNSWDESYNSSEPRVFSDQVFSSKICLGDLSKKDVFRFAVAENPEQRCVLAYLQARKNTENNVHSAEKFIEFISNGKNCVNELSKYYDIYYEPSRKNMDFIALKERYNESILVLGYILEVSLGDILYLSNSDRRNGINEIYENFKKPLKDKSIIKNYLNTKVWKMQNREDYDLIKIANDKLDGLIKKIGIERFEKDLFLYKRHLQKVAVACKMMQSQETKCNNDIDNCNYRCLISYIKKHNLWLKVYML